jgi:hypothetical protein
MKFLVADFPDGDPNQSRVEDRIINPTEKDLRSAFYPGNEIHYGTHFILYGTLIGELSVVCTSGPYAAPDVPGEFLLCTRDEVIAEHVTRDTAFKHLRSGLIVALH